MTDTFQAVYDATRSRLSNCDLGGVVESVARDAFGAISWSADIVRDEWINAAHEAQRPSVLFKPKISLDGNMYCALLGPNLMEGCAGFGATMAKAMSDFDRNFTKLQAPAIQRDQT